MKQALGKIEAKFSDLSQREKWLITLGGFAVTALVMFTFVFEPAMKTDNELSRQNVATKSEILRLQGEILVLTAKLKKDPDQEIDIELNKLQKQSQSLSQELADVIDTLISPSQMTLLLEGVLSESKQLHLVSLETLGAESIAKGQDKEGNYYLHPVRIEMTGRFFDILTYLQTLEAMPANYYWRSFQYQVEEYPEARLILEVYTLGARKEFIGG
ncbi:type 4a pilus biogenesis protein PilO [Vibrio genomosp. F10]|uniref:type 4a pilus biogenesis protein PilO n=1 Tax=Vibrio genomosp. F10 TaxID=723171 RepID=UPI00030AAFEA|nr:type 4a pilus biogenesis protein PilO [Vibrio genomosp. F10]OEE97247.1 MSHA biogenesis protein MshJ [Vibrio genomosp. F10 str. 9ZD137]